MICFDGIQKHESFYNMHEIMFAKTYRKAIVQSGVTTRIIAQNAVISSKKARALRPGDTCAHARKGNVAKDVRLLPHDRVDGASKV